MNSFRNFCSAKCCVFSSDCRALRRSSIHEKTSIAQKEAQLEAMRLREPITFQEDDDEDETIIDAITLPQVNGSQGNDASAGKSLTGKLCFSR